MHSAGLRLDDAATAADVALRVLRERRNDAIQAAESAGLGKRQIARIFQLDHAAVIRICRIKCQTPQGGD
jgi:hypothetical protein